MGVAVAASIGMSIVIQQVKLVPDFASYAREWDSRHQRIVELRESGRREVELTPFSHHITADISKVNLYNVGIGCMPYYYGVDSIVDAEA